MTTIPCHEVGTGGTLVLRYAQTLSQSARHAIRAEMQHHFPGAKVLILDSGAEIAVIRPAP